MKITKQDIQTLKKIGNMCQNGECENCCLAFTGDCLLGDIPCWWHLELIQEDKQ